MNLYFVFFLIASFPWLINQEQSLIDFSDYQEVEVKINPTRVFLVNGCQAVPISISFEQGLSIQQGMTKENYFRPNTHDLMVNFLKEKGFWIKAVRITDLKNNTYFAELIIKKGKEFIILDARPSDAIALAVRMEAPVYTHKNLFSLDLCPKEEITKINL